jgi:hypothetical protein
MLRAQLKIHPGSEGKSPLGCDYGQMNRAKLKCGIYNRGIDDRVAPNYLLTEDHEKRRTLSHDRTAKVATPKP